MSHEGFGSHPLESAKKKTKFEEKHSPSREIHDIIKDMSPKNRQKLKNTLGSGDVGIKDIIDTITDVDNNTISSMNEKFKGLLQNYNNDQSSETLYQEAFKMMIDSGLETKNNKMNEFLKSSSDLVVEMIKIEHETIELKLASGEELSSCLGDRAKSIASLL